MPRFLIYVNTNPTQRHITVHPETTAPCQFVFQHVHLTGQHAAQFPIERLERNAFRVAEGDNGYWLLVWSPNIHEVYQNEHVLSAVQDLERNPQLCENCI